MAKLDLIDLSADPFEPRRAGRRRLLRVGLPIVAVLLIASGIVATSLYGYDRNRRDVLVLANDLLTTVEGRATSELERYLITAFDAARAVAAVSESPLSPEGRVRFERLAVELLRIKPQLAMIYVGDPRGDYLMVRRTETGTIDTQHISNATERREVSWLRRRSDGSTDRVDAGPDVGYDPRTRPWYALAVRTDGIAWTDAYVFFTDRKPGLTASLALRDREGNVAAVIGIDVHLNELSTFLASLKIGRSGRAMILDGDGRLIAFPDAGAITQDEGGELRRARLDELGDPVLAQVYDRLRVGGGGRSVVEIKGTRFIVMASSLAALIGHDWSIVFVVPEQDFVGFVATNTRSMLIPSIVVVVLAVLLAALLVYRGVAAERAARALAQRRRAMDIQGRAFEALSHAAARFHPDDKAATQRLTETIAEAAQAIRVGIWRFDPASASLLCLDSYGTGGHAAGSQIHPDDCPTLFEGLRRGEEIETSDVSRDARTARLVEMNLVGSDTLSLAAVPVVQNAEVSGYIWVERGANGSDDSTTDVRGIARAVTQIIGPRFRPERAMSEAGTVPTHEGMRGPFNLGVGATRTSSIVAERLARHLSALEDANRNESGPAIVFPALTVLVLRLNDDGVVAQRAEGVPSLTICHILEFLRAAADKSGVRYLKIVGADIYMADGFDGSPVDAARHIAEIALALRRECARLLRQAGPTAPFTIGLDFGSAIGTLMGAGGSAYNVWGPAVRVAAAMAGTAQAGTIQVSEAAYGQLSDRFVFRRRGGFYLESLGEMDTYLLQAAR